MLESQQEREVHKAAVLLVEKLAGRGGNLRLVVKRFLSKYDGGSGRLGTAALERAVGEALPGLKPELLGRLAARLDLNQDGAVDIEELTRVLGRLRDGESLPPPPPPEGGGKGEAKVTPVAWAGEDLGDAMSKPRKVRGRQAQQRLEVFLAKLAGRVETLATEAHAALPSAQRLPARKGALLRALGYRVLRTALDEARPSPFVKLTPEQMRSALESFRTPGQPELVDDATAFKVWQLSDEGDPERFIALFRDHRAAAEEAATNRNRSDALIAVPEEAGARPGSPRRPSRSSGFRDDAGPARADVDFGDDEDAHSHTHGTFLSKKNDKKSDKTTAWATCRRSGPPLPRAAQPRTTTLETKKKRSGVGRGEYSHAREREGHAATGTFKLRYKHSRTLASPPVGWRRGDLARSVGASSRPPAQGLQLNHVFGFACDQPGPNLFAVPSPPRLVYASAAVGVAQTLDSSKRQTHFLGHTDDASCLCVDSTGQLAASGQVASESTQPYASVWALEDGRELVKVGGDGSIQRLVAAVCFFHDASHLAVVGGDDRHTLFVYDLRADKSRLPVITAPCKSGVQPPAVTAAYAAPDDTARRFGVDYLLVTLGRGHLAFWLIDLPRDKRTAAASRQKKEQKEAEKTRSGGGPTQRNAVQTTTTGDSEQKTSSFSTAGYECVRRLPTYGRRKPPAASLCAAFVPRDDAVVTGASDGRIYVWRDYSVAHSFQAHGESPVRSLVHAADRLYTGGGDGLIKRWDLDQGEYRLTVTNKPRNPHSKRSPDGLNPETVSDAFTSPASAANCGAMNSALSGAGVGNKTQGNAGRLASTRGKNTQQANQSAAFADMRSSGSRGVSDLAQDPADPDAVYAGTAFGHVVRVDMRDVDRTRATVTVGHHATVTDVAPHPTNSGVCATVGLDCLLCVWDVAGKSLGALASLPGPGTCLAIRAGRRKQDSYPNHCAVGLADGRLAVYALDPLEERDLGALDHDAPDALEMVVLRDDISRQPLSQARYAPDGRRLAVGSHDCRVYVLDALSSYTPLRVLKGHSSYITQLDWSADSMLLHTSCGGYEVLYWDVAAASQISSTHDSVESDTAWYDWTLTLGFPVMGIFAPDSDGTDVNCAHRSKDGKLVLVGDDDGFVKLFAAPVTCRWAAHRRYLGHSAHCLGARFLHGDAQAATAGGRDAALLVWDLIQYPQPTNPASTALSLQDATTHRVGEQIVTPPTARPAWNAGCDLASATDILRKPAKDAFLV